MTEIISLKDKVEEAIRLKTESDRQAVYDTFNEVLILRGFQESMAEVFEWIAIRALGFTVDEIPPTIFTKVFSSDEIAFFSSLFLIHFADAAYPQIFKTTNTAAEMVTVKSILSDGKPVSNEEILSPKTLIELIGGSKNREWPQMSCLVGKLWNFFLHKGWQPVLKSVEIDAELGLPAYVEIHFKGGLRAAIVQIRPLVARSDAMEYDKRLTEYNEALERRENNDGQ